MSIALYFLAGLAVALLGIAGWVLYGVRRTASSAGAPDAKDTARSDRRHVTYFPQVRQALSSEDFAFLKARGSRGLLRRARKERKLVVLEYLNYLRREFLKLWALARLIASFAPRVGLREELTRVRLGTNFLLRYELVRLKFRIGLEPLAELGALSDVVSKLSIRIETATQDIGERIALATSAAEARGLHTS